MLETTLQKLDRRTLLAGGLATAAMVCLAPSGALAQETVAGETQADTLARRDRLRELGFLWRATSPSIHLGDTFTAVMTNRGQADLTVYPTVIIMDHTRHYNLSVIDEEVTLPPGGQHTFSAVNEYGVANHFSTVMGASTGDPAVLGIDIRVADSDGTQTAQFNELAFMINTAADLAALREERRKAGGNDQQMDMS